MTEEQIRATVRDEIEEQMLRPGGILDRNREAAFNLMRGMFEMQARQTLDAFSGNANSRH